MSQAGVDGRVKGAVLGLSAALWTKLHHKAAIPTKPKRKEGDSSQPVPFAIRMAAYHAIYRGN